MNKLIIVIVIILIILGIGTIVYFIIDTNKFPFGEKDKNVEQMKDFDFKQMNNTTTPNPDKFTLEDCQDAAFKVGLTDDDAFEFFHHFRSQGFIKANQNAIVALDSQMVNWKLNKKRRATGDVKKIKLYPFKGGKTCNKEGCKMPAVYKAKGAYDFYYCTDHMPESVKEKYE